MSERLAAAFLATALVQAVHLPFLRAAAENPLSLSFFTAHVLAVGVLQVSAALLLGDWRERRAWAAAIFLLPPTLAGVSYAGELAGGVGIAALVVLAFLAWALWLGWGPVPGAPLPASVLGAAAAAEALRFRHSEFEGFQTEPIWLAWAAAVGGTALLAAASAGRLDLLARLPRARPAAGAAAILLGILVFLRGPSFRPVAPETVSSAGENERPPVVLIVLDTVRADHLASYGYSRNTMPRLEAFLDRHSIPTSTSVATSPWTLPTHGSLFTGVYPPRHGAHGARIDAPDPPPAYFYRLRQDVPTLAGLLSEAGYWTVGISANYGPLSPAFGLGRGFDVYRAIRSADAAMKKRTPWRVASKRYHPLGALDALPPFRSTDFFGVGPSYRRAAEINRDAERVLSAVADKSSFFLFLNYFDAHLPYLPPGAYEDRFPGRDPDLPNPGLVNELQQRLYFDGGEMTRREYEHLTALYDCELAYLDSQLEKLLLQLERHPRWEDMLLVITSDHGESFGEHGVLTHRSSLYREQLRVPLFVKATAENKTWGEVVSSVDLFATVLEHAGVSAPEGTDGVPRGGGRTHVPAWLHSYQEEFAEKRPGRFAQGLRSIQQGRWKLIESTAGVVELYDLENDPEEQVDRASQHPERVAAMRDRLERVAADGGPSRPSQPLSEDTRQRLRELGYIR